MQKTDNYNISDIIDHGDVVTYFQPIISLKDKAVVGVEALSRGISQQTQNLIQPLDLIHQAQESHLTLELGRLFREKALTAYSKIDTAANVLLFVNVNPKILETEDLELGWTNQKVRSLGLRSEQIAIEICESSVTDTEKLIAFVESYRNHGFIIAMDDYGTNHSNLERIIQIKPDVVKIPKELIQGVHNDFYKEATVKSITHLARNIGAVTIAEGVESQEDVLKCHELDIDLYQGFYFARPSDCCTGNYKKCRATIHKTLTNLSGYMQQYIQEKRSCHADFLNICKSILEELKAKPAATFPTILDSFDVDKNILDSLYVLNQDGRQIYKIYFATTTRAYHKHHLFQRLGDDSDHSLKDYFILSFLNDADIFISDEFVSYTSKNYCKTISAKFTDSSGEQHTLCIDFILRRTNDIGL